MKHLPRCAESNVFKMNLFQESRLTLRLGFPLMIGQLSQMLMGVVDTVMIGKLGVTDLAALTFANSLFHVPFVFGIGVLTSVSVFTSTARGGNQPEAARGSCRHGLYIATALGLLLFIVSWFISLRMDIFGQPADVAAKTTTFFRVVMASLIPALAAMALKNHADALNRPWPPFWIFIGGVLLNVVLNWITIYGKFGLPAFGMNGAAWSTLVARTAILIAMIVWLLNAKGLREWVPYRWFRKPHFPEIQRLLKIGIPASLHMLCEVTAFSAAGLIMGRFGAVSMASHQIAITCAATAFMVPVGLSMALTVRVGEANGAGDFHRLRSIVVTGWVLATAFSLTAAAALLFFGKPLAGLFVEDAAVISLTASLLVIVGVFQLFDSLQVASASMLRGLHDVHVPAAMGFVAYWLIGLPVAIMFAFFLKWTAVGVWWGLAAGLLISCITLCHRLWEKTGAPKSVERSL
jgi:multidrug resistance protein, MATE family